MDRNCPPGALDPRERPPQGGSGPRGNSFANGPDGVPKPMRDQMRMIQASETTRFSLAEGPLPF